MEKYMKNPFFHCYSFRLCHFLQSQGFRYERKCKNKSNSLTCFVFIKSDKLNFALQEWNNLKDKSKEDKL